MTYFFQNQRKEKRNVKIVSAIVIAKTIYILTTSIKNYVIVRGANIKDFMRCDYGIYTDKTRIFVQKIICFCLAMANKINNELGEKICTKK